MTNQNFTVFLPRRETVRRHARKVEKVLRPFFPGYLFIQLDIERDRWRCVNGTFGVLHLVMQNERPAPAPPGVVEALIANCDQHGVLQLRNDLAVGQKVRVIDGPLMDLVGELESLTDVERVRVLLDMMGAKTPVILSRKHLAAAEA